MKILTEKALNLESEKISKLVLSFFTTALVGLLLNTVYNLTDTLFVSWGVGDLAMGGVTIVAPFVLIQGAISSTIGGGASVIISAKLGENRNSEANAVAYNSLIIFYSVAILTTAVCFIFMEPLLKFMGASEELYPYAKDYFVIILAGNIFSTGFSSIMRAEGKNLYSMLIWIIPITLNIILDAVFILVLKWGVKGSAFATVISQIVSFLMMIFYFVKISELNLKKQKFTFSNLRKIIGMGLPSLAQMGSLAIVVTIINITLGKISNELSIIAFGYVSKLLIYGLSPFIALSQALLPIVGYNNAKNLFTRVEKAMKFCMLTALIYGIIIFIVFKIASPYLIKLFTSDLAIIEIGYKALRIVSISFILSPFQILYGAKLQAIGKPVLSFIIYSLNVLTIITPAILLGKYFHETGVWWAFVIAQGSSAAFTAIIVIYRKLMSKKLT